MAKVRLDVLLAERGLAESRNQAQRLIMAGQVRVDGQVVLKPATAISPEVALQVESRPPFVSRGGEKLEAAILGFKIDVTGLVCADVGASTGGFTDCLLQNGARRVYAIDVGQGILDWRLRNDPRVVVMEGTNARFIQRLPEPISLASVDASFISLDLLLPVIQDWFPPEGGRVVALIKPQFEAGRQVVARSKGVVRDPEIHRQVLEHVLESAVHTGYQILGLMRSPLLGPKGNTEFLVFLNLGSQGERNSKAEIEQMIARVLQPSD
jgi:23S rRNA (cytidine1920-2'-O)/16S rRNA (cytidine1409-2'-O)-methyltransferase